MTSTSSPKPGKRSKKDVTSAAPSSSSKKTPKVTQKDVSTQKPTKKKSSNQEKTSTTSITEDTLELHANETQWGNYFPEMSALPTSDPRIFQTEWETLSGEGMSVIKRKQFFACVIMGEGVDGDCYAIEVTKEWAQKPTELLTTAFERMKQIADYRETNDTWPTNQRTKEEDLPNGQT